MGRSPLWGGKDEAERDAGRQQGKAGGIEGIPYRIPEHLILLIVGGQNDSITAGGIGIPHIYIILPGSDLPVDEMGIVSGLVFRGTEIFYLLAAGYAAQGSQGIMEGASLLWIHQDGRRRELSLEMEKAEGVLPEKGDFSQRKAAAVDHGPGEIKDKPFLFFLIGFIGGAGKTYFRRRQERKERTFQGNGNFCLFSPFYAAGSLTGEGNAAPCLFAEKVKAERRQKKHD